MQEDALIEQRRQKDDFLRSHYASPLPDEDQAKFTGLAYFPPNPDMVFAGIYARGDDTTVDITSSIGTTSAYHRMGTFTVEIAGRTHELTVLDDGDGNPFIAFGDETNGEATYGGGRYVSVEIADDGSALVDFDTASNPYCVYDEEFVCPLPPPENRLPLRIEAGEKMYERP